MDPLAGGRTVFSFRWSLPLSRFFNPILRFPFPPSAVLGD
jgi:hypothetical protein